MNLFTGFSTAGADLNKDWTRYDIDLIKRDLMNHFHTRIGERRMRPTFGCRIWEYLMEPATAHNRDLIAEEAKRVCESDSRLSIQDIQVHRLENGIRVEITLFYTPFDVVDKFVVNFNNSVGY